jgi:hypothetical protein
MADKNTTKIIQKTPKNKRRRKNNKKSTPKNIDYSDDYDSSNSSAESTTTMAGEEGEPTNKQIFNILTQVQASQNFLSEKFDSFDARMAQLIIDSTAAKKDIEQLRETDQQQQQHIDFLANHVEEIEQRYLNNDLVFSGLPNLENINTSTILNKVSEIYNFPSDSITRYETISGLSKVSKKPFNIIFVTLISNTIKQHILNKQKAMGNVMWGQLLPDVPDNLKINKIYMKTRLTPFKQSILNACQSFGKEKKTQIPFVWASKFNGKIFMKELGVESPVIINSLKDLNNIKRKYAGP